MNQSTLREAKVYASCEMDAPESLSGLGGEIVVFASRCPGKNSPNEDAVAVVSGGDSRGVLVVADGMGGAAAGEEASRLAVECVRNTTVEASGSDAMLRTAILNGIEDANRNILELGVGAATTLVAMEIEDGVVRTYHAGDSTAIVVGQRGKIKLATIAHGPVSMAVEAGVIDSEEAMHHEDRHLVSNVLGSEDMRIEIGPSTRLSRYDTALLASDGLFDNLSIDEIVAHIRKGPLHQSVERLIADVRARMDDSGQTVPGKPDDLAIVAFRLTTQRK